MKKMSALLLLFFIAFSFGQSNLKDTVRYPAVFNGKVYVSHALIRDYVLGICINCILSSRDSSTWKWLSVSAIELLEVHYLGDRFVICGFVYGDYVKRIRGGKVWYSKEGSGGLWDGRGSKDTAWLTSDLPIVHCAEENIDIWVPAIDIRLVADKGCYIAKGSINSDPICFPDSVYFVSYDSCQTWSTKGTKADWLVAKDFWLYEPAPAVESKALPLLRRGLPERLQAYDVLGRPVSGALPSGVYLGRGRIIVK